MRLLHVVPTYLPAWRYGGPVFAVHGLCKQLAARGHHVTVFTTNVDGDGTLDVPVGQPVNLDSVQVHYFPAPLARIYFSPQMRAALHQRVTSFDLVHTHAVYLWPGVATARSAHRAGVPYVVSPRGMLVPELIRAKSRIAKTLWLRVFERRALARAAAIHFTSALEQAEATRTGLTLPSPFVLPNGVDLEPLPDVQRESDMLLFLGRITWKKRIESVIERLPALPGVRFVIAGNDEENLTDHLRDLAARLGVSDRVELVGPVYGARKNELLARATLFLLPSRSENFGNAVLEALAMQTPAVLSEGVGVAEEVVKAGAGVIGLDQLAELLADPARRSRMGTNGRGLVERRFTWTRVAEEMERAYERIRESR